MSKNAKKFRKCSAIGYNLLPTQGGGTFCPTPLHKKEASSGFLEVGVFLAEDVGYPEAADVVGQGLGRHEAQAVLLGDVFEFDCCTHIFVLFYSCFFVKVKKNVAA